jgi:starvation-inducible outer membrane lipoprotein
MFKKTLLVICCLLFVSGCSSKPEEMDSKQVKKISDNMSYFQDENAKPPICFGVVSTKKYIGGDQQGIGLTVVPCKNVQHLLIK